MKRLLICLLLVGCAGTQTQEEAKTTKKMLMVPSFYHIAKETTEESGPYRDIFDKTGKPIARVKDSFYKRLCLEGTGKLLDGRLLNYWDRLYDSYRFTEVAFPTGAKGAKIVAFKSLACDPAVLPIGSKLFIAKTKGVKLPNNSIHDGFWSCDDTGSAIKGNRIDLFTGEYDWKLLEAQGVVHGQALEVEVLI